MNANESKFESMNGWNGYLVTTTNINIKNYLNDTLNIKNIHPLQSPLFLYSISSWWGILFADIQ